jgi:hypothetical protein
LSTDERSRSDRQHHLHVAILLLKLLVGLRLVQRQDIAGEESTPSGCPAGNAVASTLDDVEHQRRLGRLDVDPDRSRQDHLGDVKRAAVVRARRNVEPRASPPTDSDVA